MSLEFILWLLLAFFIGCIIGYLLRWLFAPEPGVAATGASTPTTASAHRISEPEATTKPASPIVPARAASPAPAKPMPTAKTSPKPKPTPASEAKAPAEKPNKARATGKSKRPRGLAAARGGKADNLQQISGVGPKLEKTLHGLGFFHFSQIADWSPDEILWVEEHLRFKGRIERDKWIRQAKALATAGPGKSGSPAKSAGKKRGG